MSKNRLLPQLCGLLLAAWIPAAQAQETNLIRGTVYESGRENEILPLPGVLIRTPDMLRSTSTDTDGDFSITLSDSTSKLIFSMQGYEPDTVSVSGAPLQIIMQRSRALGEVVITGNQQTTRIGMLDPIQTHHISERELMKAACCNLSESFETTPSVDAAYTDAVTGYRQIQMLGLTGPYTLITRENIPDVRGLAAITGLTFTPGTWIESMQLSKGTGSVVNGYESVAGQLNIELRKPFEGDRWHFNLYQNTQGRSEANIVSAHKISNRLSTNIMLHGRSQWAKVDQNGDGFMDQPTGNQFVGLNRWFYFSPKGLEIQAGIKGVYGDNTGGRKEYTRATPQVPGNPWGYRADISRAEGWAKIGKISVTRPWRSAGLQLSALYHDQDAQYGQRAYLAMQKSLYANFIYQTIIGNTNHTIKTGASFLSDNYRETFAGTAYQRAEYVPGVFTEYSWKWQERFNLVAGIRGDYHNIFGAFATPRVHLRYAPSEHTAIRVSAGRAQRTASIFAENTGNMASNRAFIIRSSDSDKPYGLDPEVAWNTGINLTHKFRLNYREGTFSTDYYYTGFRNQVVVDLEDPHTVSFYNLTGRSFAHSFQAQVDYEPVRKWDLRLAYRYYNVRTTYEGVLRERPLIAAHRAFINTGYRLGKNWNLDYTIQWISPKRIPSVHDHDGPGIRPERYSPSFIQMSAQISKGWKNNLEVYLGGENLTNFMQHDMILGASDPFAAGFDASMIWGAAMGRNIYAGLRYRIP